MENVHKAEYAISENPYESIVVDITSRCNMSCNFCYNPTRSLPDMGVEHFEYVCRNLPFPVSMKLSGGEPTLHPNILDFIHIAHKYGHKVYIISNGTKYIDPVFMNSLRELKKTGTTFSLGLSMDGGYTNKYAYEVINGEDCSKQKLEAFNALVSYRLARVCLTAIIVRGLNEDVIPQLIRLAKRHERVVRYIHFRNMGIKGVCINTEPYSIPYSIRELKELVSQYFTEEEFRPKCIAEIHCLPESGNECCYRFRPTNRLQISIVEFDSEKSAMCPKRGRLVIGTDRLQPLFKSMKRVWKRGRIYSG